MIYFDIFNRQFSSTGVQREFGLNTLAGLGGGTAQVMMRNKKKKELEQQLIAQGKSPSEARKEAMKRYGGNVENAIKGAAKGVLANQAVGIVGKSLGLRGTRGAGLGMVKKGIVTGGKFIGKLGKKLLKR